MFECPAIRRITRYQTQEDLGETMGKTYFVTDVPPGEHYVVAATENTGIAHLNFEAGKSYFLQQGIAMGMWRARTSGLTRPSAVGPSELK